MNGLEEEFANELTVIRADVQSETGKSLAPDYGSFTPTFVFIDAEGNELWRAIGTLDPEEVRQSMQ